MALNCLSAFGMKSYGFLFFFALCATASSIPATVGEVGPKQLTKFYEVNLDLAPEDRWVAIGKEFKDVAGPILNKYLSQVRSEKTTMFSSSITYFSLFAAYSESSDAAC